MAQVSQNWATRYNGPANKFDGVRALAIDNQNNVYVAGPCEVKKGNSDYAVVKYSSAGTKIWDRRYNGNGNGEDWADAITVDQNRNVYVTGRSVGSGSDLDMVTIKYDEAGNEKWVNRFNGSSSGADYGKDVKVDALGNVFVTGFANGPSLSAGSALVLIKIDGNLGNLIWTATHDVLPGENLAVNKEEGNSLVLDGSSIYVTGVSGGAVTIKFSDLGTTFLKQWAVNYGGGNGRRILKDQAGNVVIASWGAGFVNIKYDPAGNVLWQSFYYEPNGDAAVWDMALDANDNVYVTGYRRDGTINNSDYATVKYNSSGVFQWASFYKTSTGGRDMARSIAVDGSGNCYVTGTSETVISIKNGNVNANSNIATVKYDANGVQQWVIQYDGPDKSVEEGFGVAVDNLNNVYVGGQSAGKLTYIDFVTIKYIQSQPRIIPTTNPNVLQLKNYPNPFSSETTFDFVLPDDAQVKLTIVNILGMEVAEVLNAKLVSGKYRIPYRSGLKAGTYFYRMQTGTISTTGKMIVVH